MSATINNNILVKEQNRISKFKNVETEIEKNWLFKTTSVPEIVEALGMIRKRTDEYIKKIPGNPSLYKIQQNTHCGTVRLFR